MSSKEISPVDLVKLVAAFGVVFIHLDSRRPPKSLQTCSWSSPSPTFSLISLYFFIARSTRFPHSGSPLFGWIAFWSPTQSTRVYFLMRLLKFHLNGKSLPIDPVGFAFFGSVGWNSIPSRCSCSFKRRRSR